MPEAPIAPPPVENKVAEKPTEGKTEQSQDAGEQPRLRDRAKNTVNNVLTKLRIKKDVTAGMKELAGTPPSDEGKAVEQKMADQPSLADLKGTIETGNVDAAMQSELTDKSAAQPTDRDKVEPIAGEVSTDVPSFTTESTPPPREQPVAAVDATPLENASPVPSAETPTTEEPKVETSDIPGETAAEKDKASESAAEKALQKSRIEMAKLSYTLTKELGPEKASALLASAAQNPDAMGGLNDLVAKTKEKTSAETATTGETPTAEAKSDEAAATEVTDKVAETITAAEKANLDKMATLGAELARLDIKEEALGEILGTAAENPDSCEAVNAILKSLDLTGDMATQLSIAEATATAAAEASGSDNESKLRKFWEAVKKIMKSIGKHALKGAAMVGVGTAGAATMATVGLGGAAIAAGKDMS